MADVKQDQKKEDKPAAKQEVAGAQKLVKIIPDFSMSMPGGIHFDLGKEVAVSAEVIEKLKIRKVSFKIV